MEVAWKKKRRKKRKWIVPREARKKQNTLKAEQEREYTKSGTRVRAVSQVSLSSLRAVECATTRSGPPRPSLSSRFFFHRPQRRSEEEVEEVEDAFFARNYCAFFPRRYSFFLERIDDSSKDCRNEKDERFLDEDFEEIVNRKWRERREWRKEALFRRIKCGKVDRNETCGEKESQDYFFFI